MSSTGLEVFDKTLQTTNLWLKEIGDDLGPDRQRCYHALRAVLFALRDRLTVDEASDLSAQLPMLMRGFYYEGWHAAAPPKKIRDKEEFLDYVSSDAFPGLGLEAEQAVRAVFEVMANRLDPGEVDKLIKLFPEQLRELWPTVRPH